MNILQFVGIKLTFFIAIGIVIGFYWEPSSSGVLITVIVIMSVLSVLLLCTPKRKEMIFGMVAMCTALCVGIMSIALHRDFSYRQQFSNAELRKPHLWKLEIVEVLKPTKYYHRYVARILTVDSISSAGKILCRTSLDYGKLQLAVDDQLLVKARADEISKPLNPHQFNYRKYQQKLGIYHQLKLGAENNLIFKKSTTSVFGMADQLRQRIGNELHKRNFEAESLSIIQALLLGERDNISDSTYDNYRDAGALHILAVSGLHIGIVLLMVQYLLRPLDLFPGGKLLKMVLTLILLWSYAVVAGFSASVIRAVTMFSFLSYSNYLNRPGISFNILALSMAFILLIIDPLYLFQPGFQLSYSAVFSILWLYPKLLTLVYPKTVLSSKIWQLISVSLAAQAGILPVNLYYFHQFPALFLISNLIIVPFLGLILGMGFLMLALMLMDILPDLLVVLYDQLIISMNSLIEWVASREGFVIENIYFDHGHIILSYILLVTMVWMLRKPGAKRIFVTAAVIISLQCWDGYSRIRLRLKEQLAIMHSIGNTVLFHQKDGNVKVYSSGGEFTQRLISDFKTAERISNISCDSVQNAYRLKNKNLLILDHNGLKSSPDIDADILLLASSPRLNLDRILQNHRPELVIADGSNYRSYVERWQRSCRERDIPFHNTSEKGAFITDLH